ncbi:MAG: DUF2442 domain-containing protein [Pirellulales bacterium]|nr:DUF2442 domain-containing protein [Pirellulales bacterium]
MNTEPRNAELEHEVAASRAWADGRTIFIELHDHRIIGFPANRFQRLRDASDKELEEVSVEVNGYALRWENLDEDLTVNGILAGHFQLPPETEETTP